MVSQELESHGDRTSSGREPLKGWFFPYKTLRVYERSLCIISYVSYSPYKYTYSNTLNVLALTLSLLSFFCPHYVYIS